MQHATRGMPTGIHTVDLAHAATRIHTVDFFLTSKTLHRTVHYNKIQNM
ncbi:MAG: hypothetical protein OXI43_18475 [Candidatus Poribacteria bacterium]|nr:hypothetical protein [Candidatus Poribacteria bacterium]